MANRRLDIKGVAIPSVEKRKAEDNAPNKIKAVVTSSVFVEDEWLEVGQELIIQFHTTKAKREYVLENYDTRLRKTTYRITTGDLLEAQRQIQEIRKHPNIDDPYSWDSSLSMQEYKEMLRVTRRNLDILTLYQDQEKRQKQKIKVVGK